MDIIPETMHVKVGVTQPKKTVPIQVVAVGTMEEDLAIETCTLSLDEITLYGKQSVLDQISSIEVSLPVSGINSDRTLNMPITLPSGVTSASANQVTISITVGERTSRTFSDVPIDRINVSDALADKQIQMSDETVDVTVYGSETMLQNIDKEDIMVTADLKGISENGETTLALAVSGSNRLVEYDLSIDEITVTVND